MIGNSPTDRGSINNSGSLPTAVKTVWQQTHVIVMPAEIIPRQTKITFPSPLLNNKTLVQHVHYRYDPINYLKNTIPFNSDMLDFVKTKM